MPHDAVPVLIGGCPARRISRTEQSQARRLQRPGNMRRPGIVADEEIELADERSEAAERRPAGEVHGRSLHQALNPSNFLDVVVSAGQDNRPARTVEHAFGKLGEAIERPAPRWCSGAGMDTNQRATFRSTQQIRELAVVLREQWELEPEIRRVAPQLPDQHQIPCCLRQVVGILDAEVESVFAALPVKTDGERGPKSGRESIAVDSATMHLNSQFVFVTPLLVKESFGALRVVLRLDDSRVTGKLQEAIDVVAEPVGEVSCPGEADQCNLRLWKAVPQRSQSRNRLKQIANMERANHSDSSGTSVVQSRRVSSCRISRTDLVTSDVRHFDPPD